MADDIDDLLDEVENKYCAKGKSKFESSKKTSSKSRSRGKLEDDIDDILADDDLPQLKGLNIEKKSTSNSTSSHSRPDSSRKCFPVYLGGSSHSFGLASSVNKRACDKLRCTACDFRVCSFENFEWSSKTDYLFLRNNVPEFEKLKPNLRSKRGMRAYCCQCSWKSAQELEEIRDPQLKWVCGRH